MLVYADSSQLAAIDDTYVPNIIVVGGFAVRRDEADALIDRIREVKAVYARDRFVPIKWNIQDFRDVIEERGGDDFYREVADASADIRSGMLEALRASEGICFTSVIHAHSEREQALRDVGDDLPRYSFVNLLQRLGYCVRDHIDGRSEVQLVLDWPPGNDRKPWEEEYTAGFAEGDSADSDHEHPYHVGPLRDLGFRPGLLYGNTQFNEGLQLADLVVGVTRHFVQHAHLDQHQPDGFGVREFADLLPSFYGYDAGQVVGRGIAVSPRDGGLVGELEDKIQEL